MNLFLNGYYELNMTKITLRKGVNVKGRKQV